MADILEKNILTDEILSQITFYLEDLENISIKVDELLKINLEKENPIFDENDFELKMIGLDGGYEELGDFNYNLIDNGGFLDFNKKLFEEDLRDIIRDYENILLNFVIYIDNSLENLKEKTNYYYKMYFKAEITKILDSTSFKYGDYNNYLKLTNELAGLIKSSESNPYRIILNSYLYYLDIIYVFINNLRKNDDNIYKQAEVIQYGLPINLSTFEYLKKWEDSIKVLATLEKPKKSELDHISIYDLVDKNSN